MQTAWSRLIVLSLALLILGACALPRTARNHEVLDEGVISVGVVAGASIGDATVKIIDFNDEAKDQDGRAGVVSNDDTSGALTALQPFMIQARLGAFDGCELGFDLGVPRLGGELRCRGFRPSGDLAPGMAWWLGGAWMPLDGWEGGLGLDFGRWFGHFSPFVNMAVTFGAHTHVLLVSGAQYGTPESDDLLLTTTELAARLELGFGVAYRITKDETPFILTLTMQPHFSIWSMNPPGVSCDDCVRAREIRAFREHYGVAFLFGAEKRFRLWGDD